MHLSKVTWVPCFVRFHDVSVRYWNAREHSAYYFGLECDSRGPQLFRIMSMALRITAGITESIGDSWIGNHNFYVSFWIFSISPYIMNHAIHKPLFGKQESQESIQESRNQAKNLKIPESRRRKFRVADPSMWLVA